MVLHVARGVGSAAGSQARVLAAVVPAGLVARAAAVSQADGEGGVAVAHTHAHRAVLEYLARLVTGARGAAVTVGEAHAWVRAVAGDASAVRGAMLITCALGVFRCTLQLATFAQHESALTDAHGSVSVHLAAFVAATQLDGPVAGVVALLCLQVARE